jgi:DNA-binding transcriptional LysR family regulator
VDLDLAQVRAFVAVADEGHFGRAAQTLALTQQALSKRVARLESRLGPLLERGPGGVRLTEAGERFLPAARQLLELAEHAVSDARQEPAAPLRVDVWSEIQSPAAAMRALARAQPDLVVDLSMRRDLVEALRALQRHEIDLAFGNIANLGRPLPRGLSADLVLVDAIAVLVNAESTLAGRDHLTPADLAHTGLWFPLAGSSRELVAFAEEYARSIGAALDATGSNVGLDAAVERVSTDPTRLVPIVATWPLAGRPGVRVVPLRPTPLYPWYAIWRTSSAHRSLRRVLRALRGRDARGAAPTEAWLPEGARSAK